MKIPRKLSINQNKVMKNEELVNLRGGYMNQLICRDWYGQPTGSVIILSGCNGNADNDLGICNDVYSGRAHTATCYN